VRGTADPARRRSVPRLLALGLGWALLLAGLAGVLLYAIPALQMVGPRTVMVAAFIPYGMVAWLGAAVMFLTAGRRWFKAMAVFALAGMMLQASWSGPYWPRESVSTTQSFVLMSMNLRCNPVGIDELDRIASTVRPDVVVLQGVGREAWVQLGHTEWTARLPRWTFHAMPDLVTCGSMVFSRGPLTVLTGPAEPQPVVRATLEGGPILILPVDFPTPSDGLEPWSAGFEALGESVERFTGEPMLLAGDFNAVREHAPMRRLLEQGTGLQDAAEASGVGWLATFRANRALPPLIALDHVLVSPELGVATVETARIGENAHLAVIAHVFRVVQRPVSAKEWASD